MTPITFGAKAIQDFGWSGFEFRVQASNLFWVERVRSYRSRPESIQGVLYDAKLHSGTEASPACFRVARFQPPEPIGPTIPIHHLKGSNLKALGTMPLLFN